MVASQDGTRRWTLEENAHPPLLDFERGRLESLELEAADGTRLYASLLKPADFDPGRRYPVILNVYGGPHVQTVRNSWNQVSPFDQLLASHGFLVFWLDNRGSAGRGTVFLLNLPLTLAVIKALLFRVGEKQYALPFSAVAEITSIPALSRPKWEARTLQRARDFRGQQGLRDGSHRYAGRQSECNPAVLPAQPQLRRPAAL